MRRRRQVIAWVGALVLLALHLDSWRPQRVELWFGWLPEEMAWRLAWMALAWVYLVWFCAAVWAADDPAADGAGKGAGKAADGGGEASR